MLKYILSDSQFQELEDSYENRIQMLKSSTQYICTLHVTLIDSPA